MTENDINKYNNGKIYTLRCYDDVNLIYVGSTTQPLHKRWHAHKNSFNKDKNQNRLLCIKMKEIGIDKFYIELHETFSCNSKEELNKREGEVIREIGNLNMCIPCRTHKEYYEENIEQIKDKHKIYYQEHKDEKREYEKKYLSIPENKEKVNAYHLRRYHEKIKEEYNKKRNEKVKVNVQCECGCVVQDIELTRHRKSKKHIKLLEEQN
jgi:hypothetical protein